MSVVCSDTPLFTAINTCSPAKHTYNHLICVSKLSLHMRQPQTWGASTTQLSKQGTWTRDVLSQIIKHCDVTDSQALCCHRQSSTVLSQSVTCCVVTDTQVLWKTVKHCAVTDSQALCRHSCVLDSTWEQPQPSDWHTCSFFNLSRASQISLTWTPRSTKLKMGTIKCPRKSTWPACYWPHHPSSTHWSQI